MGLCGAVGIHYRRRGGCTRPGDGALSDDLVNRAFDPDGPDRLWCMDITEHPSLEGKVYLAVVLDAFSRRVVGWSIADHLRAELVADALQMATWRRQPPQGQTIAHSDHGGQYVSWLFGTRLRAAGLLGSMGSVGDCFDNSVAEAFFSSLQRELLDQHHWATRHQLATAIFEWIECWYNPTAATATATGSAPSTTRPPRRHDHHTQPVRHTGVLPALVTFDPRPEPKSTTTLRPRRRISWARRQSSCSTFSRVGSSRE